jgi:hypothetical protein
MIAAFLPIPPTPMFLNELYESQRNVDESSSIHNRSGLLDEARYESVRWWRNLNRGMSVLGVLIIATVVICPLHVSFSMN